MALHIAQGLRAFKWTTYPLGFCWQLDQKNTVNWWLWTPCNNHWSERETIWKKHWTPKHKLLIQMENLQTPLTNDIIFLLFLFLSSLNLVSLSNYSLASSNLFLPVLFVFPLYSLVSLFSPFNSISSLFRGSQFCFCYWSQLLNVTNCFLYSPYLW